MFQKVMSDFCMIQSLLNIRDIVPTNRGHNLLLEMGIEKVRGRWELTPKYPLENGFG